MQLPHDLLGWLTTGSILLSFLWFILSHTIVKSINGLRSDLDGLRKDLKESNKQGLDHEMRLLSLEQWKKDKWGI